MIIARRKDVLPGNALPHFLGVGVCVSTCECAAIVDVISCMKH